MPASFLHSYLTTLCACSVYGPEGDYPLLPASQPSNFKSMLLLRGSRIQVKSGRAGDVEGILYVEVRVPPCGCHQGICRAMHAFWYGSQTSNLHMAILGRHGMVGLPNFCTNMFFTPWPDLQAW